MVLLGTIVNAVLIVIGAILGRFLRKIPDRMKETIMYGIGLVVAVIGIQMTFETTQILIVIVSIVVGAIIGEWIDLDKQVTKLGNFLQFKLLKGDKESNIAEGFVTATLIFVIGSMAIIGAIDSGMRQDHDLLIVKGMIDGFTSIILSSTIGIGVAFSALAVFLYEGTIALFAAQISKFIPASLLQLFISEMTATGGIMIIAIGLNLIGLTKIRVANLVPGIVVVGIIVSLIHFI